MELLLNYLVVSQITDYKYLVIDSIQLSERENKEKVRPVPKFGSRRSLAADLLDATNNNGKNEGENSDK